MASSSEGITGAIISIYNLQSDVYHDLHPREIRLVRLLRGQWSEKINCQLHHAALANRNVYKALSYAWGSPRATRPILVNGCHHPVTVNLESALRRLRRNDSDLTLWIDALCINQSNDSERTEQVNLMHDIYDFAEEVIVYLGEVSHQGSMVPNKLFSTSTTTFLCNESDEENLNIFLGRCNAENPSAVRQGKAKIDPAFDLFCFIRLLAGDPARLPSFDLHSQEFIDTKFQRNIFEGLRQLMLCRWWNRIWVIQEVVVPKIVTMVYGSATAPWDMFVEAARWSSHNRSYSAHQSFPHEYLTILAYFSRIILDIDRMRELWRDGKQTAFLPLLRRFSGRKASDDRDKVYALLSLARNQTSIIPDYRLTVPGVFQFTVLDIIKTTRSLSVLSGDLGRKYRQDLPSWVPDWSASYDDLDRRRADNTEIYNASNGCQVYVQDKEAKEWGGLRQYLGEIEKYINAETISNGDHVERYNDILRTSDWIDWIPVDLGDRSPSLETCLAAIEKFYSASGRAVCLRNYGEGVIRLAGLEIDKIAITAETAFSDDMVLLVVRSWADLVGLHFLNRGYDRSSSGLGDAFRRTMCADTVAGGSGMNSFTRRIDGDDHGLIATWFLQGLDSRVISNPPYASHRGDLAWEKLFKDVGDPSAHTPPQPVSPSIDTAIRLATVRRTFFITDKGYIGLGPAKMHAGDYLYIILGGTTPFILRNAGSRETLTMPNYPRMGKVKRNCFEVVGDCYAHGLMDGEAMQEWKEVAGSTKETTLSRELLNQWQSILQRWERCSMNLSSWRKEILIGYFRIGGYEKSGLDIILEKIVKLSCEAEDEEAAKKYTSDLSKWKDLFRDTQETNFMIGLLKAAVQKVKEIEKDIADAEYEMDGLEDQVRRRDQDIEQKGHVYLV